MKKRTRFDKGCLWKKIAIGCLILFLIIVLLNTIRILKFRSEFRSKFGSFISISEDQNEKTLSILEKMSDEEGYKLEDYDIKISPEIREVIVGGQKRHILTVILENEREFKSYTLDMGTWEILQSSEIKYSGWMAIRENQRFLHNILPPPKIFDMKRGWIHSNLIK